MLGLKHFPIFKRLMSTHLKQCKIFEPLPIRSLISLQGEGILDFLQGLTTNDVFHLTSDHWSLYSMFLNVKGRVLYDAIIYKTGNFDKFYIECDKKAVGPLCNHLRLYLIRRKISITESDKQVGVLFKLNGLGNQGDISSSIRDNVPESLTDLKIYADPRTKLLGYRVIFKKDAHVVKTLNDFLGNIELPKPKTGYRYLRYSLGIGEGVLDLPPGNCFPFESNCDYLHGVSFHKGCYIGQELTARTYHTGVTRKRLMPLLFDSEQNEKNLPKDNVIVYKGQNLGKLRGIEGKCGLALLRFQKAIEFGSIEISDSLAKIAKPSWWPLEASKDKLQQKKYFYLDMAEEPEVKLEEVKPKLEANIKKEDSVPSKEKDEVKYFQCSSCLLKEKYDYFGMDPPFLKNYILMEDSYVIEDPFCPPKQNEIIILGSNCVLCKKGFCKDQQCSIYYDATYCIQCAKGNLHLFPEIVKDKLNKIVLK